MTTFILYKKVPVCHTTLAYYPKFFGALVNEFVVLVSFVFRTRNGGRHGHALFLSLNWIFLQVMNSEPTLSSELFEIQLIRNGCEASGPALPPVSF